MATIKAAVMTGAGQAGIAQVEMVGEGCVELFLGMFRALDKGRAGGNRRDSKAVRGRLMLGWVCDGQEVVDQVVAALYEGTGGQMERVTINCHGSGYITDRLLEILAGCGVEIISGYDMLELGGWGECNIQREIECGLARACGRLAVKAVAGQWPGGLYGLFGQLADELERGKLTVNELQVRLKRLAGTYSWARYLFEQAVVVVAGMVNSGKSTLVNALAGTHLNITADVAGTTRDWTEQSGVIHGLQVRLIDTAGWHSNDADGWERGSDGQVEQGTEADVIEKEAIKTGQQQIERADVVLLVLDAGLGDVAGQAAGMMQRLARWADKKVIVVINKIDLAGQVDGGYETITTNTGSRDIMCVCVSALRGDGLRRLCDAIMEQLGVGDFDGGEALIFTERQRRVVERLLAVKTAGEALEIVRRER